MATIDYSKSAPQTLNERALMVVWAGLGQGDDGEPIELAQYADRTVQVVGTFGAGGTVRIEGSLDGINYAPVTDPQGNSLDFTTAKLEAVSEVVRWLRPRVTAGDGTTDVTVHALLKGSR